MGFTMKLGIGTVQFGMKYGLTKPTEKTSIIEAKKIIEMAQQNKITLIDTAKLYGNSEAIIGKILPANHQFKITTKLPKLNTINNASKEVEKLYLDSINKLNQTFLYGLLLHHPYDLFSPIGKEIYNVLSRMKKQGLVRKIGISIYSQYEAEKILESYDIDIIQLPINILDQRFLQSGFLKTLRKLGVEIHARSVFLQGLILANPRNLSSYFDPIKDILLLFEEELARQNISKVEAALKFVNNIEEVDYIIVGLNDCIQLKENLQSLNNKIPYVDFSKFAINKEQFVNPVNWIIK